MSDNTPQEPEEQPAAAEPQEPQVSLTDAAAQATREKPAAKAQELQQQIQQELTPELTEKVNKLVESATGSAVDGARRKMEGEFDKRLKEGGYMTPEQVDERIQAAASQSKREAEATRNLDRTLSDLGVKPGSEEYKKVEAAFSQGLEDGTFTHGTLLTEIGIKSVAFASGVLQPEAPAEDPALPGIGSHSALPPKDENMRPGDLDQLVEANMRKALGF